MTDKLNFNELKEAGRLPSPKGVALKVMRLCQMEEVNLTELAYTISCDPALSGYIIKLANAANPNKHRPIASVTSDTLIIAGINAIRQAVIALSLVSNYQKGKCTTFDYLHFWLESVAMACIAQRIGATIRIAPLSELFTCGLLTEIGQLGLATARPEEYAELLKRHHNEPLEILIETENQQFGMGRRAFSAAMMYDWGMPQLFIDVAAVYDSPGVGGFTPGSRQYNFAQALHLAARLASIFVAINPDRKLLLPKLFEIGSLLKLSPEQVITIANQASQDWMEWSKMLHVIPHRIPAFEIPDNLTPSS